MVTRRKFLTQGSLGLTAMSLPIPLKTIIKSDSMKKNEIFDVIIVGGSYSGLSAAMALGRALRKVLIIDSGKPCNIQTPHSHNFLTQDGKIPKEISKIATEQVKQYKTIQFYSGLASSGQKTANGFEIITQLGDRFETKKIIFASGVKDIMPNIKGFSECWGISVIHCPYCHGYEFKNVKTGILANGETAFEMGKLINNWTKELTIFTNGKSTINELDFSKLKKHKIEIVEKEIDYIAHKNGTIESLIFKDGSNHEIKALYARPKFDQNSEITKHLGCEIMENNLIKVNSFQQTSQYGIYACGDNSSMMRSVSYAVATGGIAGAMINRELIEESF